MIVRNDISKVREDIEGLIGQHVVIRCNKGKRRTTINKGVLESTYPSVFVVAINDDFEQTSLKTSFSYTDLLTKKVEFLAEGEEASKNFIIENE